MIAIVAVDRNWAIGKDDHLLFRLPTDMKRFRALTQNRTVLLGRKTLESFPNGKPLPNRRNIVLSSHDIPGVETVHTLDELVNIGGNDAIVIGGGSVYKSLLPFCTRVFVTRIGAEADAPDTWFPDLDQDRDWCIAEEKAPITEQGVTYRFVEYRRISTAT